MPIHSLTTDLQPPKIEREKERDREERVGEWEGLSEKAEREDRVKEERREKRE